MAIKVALEHRTTYRFDRPVALGPHIVRLRPAPHGRTPITAYSLRVSPAEHFLNWQQDPYGNHLARLVFPERTTELEVVVDLIAEMTVVNPFDFFLEEYAERFPFGYDDALAADLEPYLRPASRAPRPVRVGPWRHWLAAFGAGRPRASATWTSWSGSTSGSPPTSPTRCGWSRVSSRPRRPWARRSARAATRPGCWWPSCASSAWRRASCPAT